MKKISILLLSGIFLAFPLASRTVAANAWDDNCQAVSGDEWRIEKSFGFTDRGTFYQLVFSRTTDGSGSLCLTRGKAAKPIGLKYWQAEYIDRLDRLSPKVFTFQIHKGNGNNTPTQKYRLNLTEPQNPKIVLLKQWVVP